MPGTSWEVIARVASLSGGSTTSSRAGIMARTALGAAEVEAFIGVTTDSRLSWIRRTTAATATNTASLGAPRWVRLVRGGADFSSHHLTDGVNWTLAGTTAITSATDPMLVGLATTNAAGSTNAVAAFTDVNIALTNNIGAAVDAGAAISAGIGQPFNLDATVTDDGKPGATGGNGGGLATLWTRRSGPGAAVFGNAAAVDTTVAFDTPGNQVLRLIANDTQVKTFADTSGTAAVPAVSVAASAGASETGPANGAFTFTRSGPTTVALAVPFTIAGTATAGGDYISLPASVTIAISAASVPLSVNPLTDALAEGDEMVDLTITSDAAHYTIAAASASVVIADLPIDRWRFAKFGADANTRVIAGDLADPDGDGSLNLLEYAFGTDPHVSDASPALAFVGSELALIYRRSVAATDVTFDVWATTDFTRWSDAGESEQILSDDGIERIVRAVLPYSAGPQMFYRIEVTRGR